MPQKKENYCDCDVKLFILSDGFLLVVTRGRQSFIDAAELKPELKLGAERPGWYPNYIPQTLVEFPSIVI